MKNSRNKNETLAFIDKIRSTLRGIDLRIADAKAEMKIASEDRKLKATLGGKNNLMQSAVAQVYEQAYEIYLQNLQHCRDEMMEEISIALRGFPENYRNLWIRYFIDGKTYQQLSDETDYSYSQVSRIIPEMTKVLMGNQDQFENEVFTNE